MSSAKWRPFCLSLNVLNISSYQNHWKYTIQTPVVVVGMIVKYMTHLISKNILLKVVTAMRRSNPGLYSRVQRLNHWAIKVP